MAQHHRNKWHNYTEISSNRLLLYDKKKKPVKWWALMQNVEGCFFRKAIENNIVNGKITFKQFEENIMTLGYPKKTAKDKYLRFKHKGIEIRTGNPNWGAEENKRYFVIMHGRYLHEA